MRRLVAIVCFLLAPGLAFAHEVLYQVERGKAVAVKAYFADGEALAYTEYQVFSPADPKIPHQKGRTDREGYVAFVPNLPGKWRVVVTDVTGHGLDITVDTVSAVTTKPVADWAFILRPIVGVLVIAGLFTGLFFILRKRAK